ncbi:NurA domain [Geoglobus ahangari]|uniref:NurA domain n=1 Tax=Geoglobus ahangari TaxID=113653 RepID=A0A0F7IGE8_9EURY|nr:DNA double-strand break repair nuclease NurA [Geoglobus ahangari]AKG91699.1 NurA domain [Geoglobus ahangari]NOY11393.1 DNA double-strand break repair nuclease NurA [Archaeoglobi archaeon]
MSMEGRLFDNIHEFVRRVEEIRSRKFDVWVEKRRISRSDEFEILDGLRVLGVDGSQIAPLKDFGIPFGGVQSAGILVHHGSGRYDVRFRSRLISDTNLEFERFRLEIEMVKENLGEVDYAFYDGSLGAPYMYELNEALKRAYRMEIDELLRLSERLGVPVIGYVDRSYMKDLRMGVYDTYVLSDHLSLYEYTSPIQTGSPMLAVYFRPNPSLPVRVEIPAWCEEMVDEIMEVVYAECRLGSTSGYPYILERAHKNARISEKEKKAFVSVLKSAGISFKYMSKVIE